MNAWMETVQQLIDWLEEHITTNPSLLDMAQHIGYSPYHCSAMFHVVSGMTLREYRMKRRLTLAALALRDTELPLVEVALAYGFSSQSALNRAFQEVYGCTPLAYRKHPVPIPMTMRKVVVFPDDQRGEMTMEMMKKLAVRVEYIPAHHYLGVYDPEVKDYGSLWQRHDCDKVAGVVDSIRPADADPIITPHTAGWTWVNGQRNYFYGLGVPVDYHGAVPEGFSLRGVFPGSYYLVFSHPPFDFLRDNVQVMSSVEELAWHFDPTTMGYAWHEDECQDYQRHYPEGLGYQILRPVRRLGEK